MTSRNLPDLVLELIFCYSDPTSYLNVRATCTDWKKLAGRTKVRYAQAVQLVNEYCQPDHTDQNIDWDYWINNHSEDPDRILLLYHTLFAGKQFVPSYEVSFDGDDHIGCSNTSTGSNDDNTNKNFQNTSQPTSSFEVFECDDIVDRLVVNRRNGDVEIWKINLTNLSRELETAYKGHECQAIKISKGFRRIAIKHGRRLKVIDYYSDKGQPIAECCLDDYLFNIRGFLCNGELLVIDTRRGTRLVRIDSKQELRICRMTKYSWRAYDDGRFLELTAVGVRPAKNSLYYVDFSKDLDSVWKQYCEIFSGTANQVRNSAGSMGMVSGGGVVNFHGQRYTLGRHGKYRSHHELTFSPPEDKIGLMTCDEWIKVLRLENSWHQDKKALLPCRTGCQGKKVKKLGSNRFQVWHDTCTRVYELRSDGGRYNNCHQKPNISLTTI